MRGAASLLSGSADANHDTSMTLYVHVAVAMYPMHVRRLSFGPICVVDGENECRTMPRGRRAAPPCARAPAGDQAPCC